MRPGWPEFARTTSVRLALLYAGLFGISALALFVVIYWAADASVAGQIDANLDVERVALEVRAGARDAVSVAARVTERRRTPGNRFSYLVLDASDDVIAGDLPGPVGRHAGYHDLELAATSTNDPEPDNEARAFRALGQPLPGGGFLVIAQDAHELDELRELIARSFAWGAGATLLLAALGGGAMSAGVLRRIEAINRASERIMAGDLARRLPIRARRGGGDEFDRLAANLNLMLDRIEQLVEGLRQVSTDIAHDLRTPLGRLRQTLEAARGGAPVEAAPDHLAAIDRAIAEADTLLATFGALLRIAQIEAGASRRGFGTVDLSAVLEAVIEVYGPAAEEKNQTLVGRVPPGVSVTGDRPLLTQMGANLVENAIRHAPEGATVELALEAAASDRGPQVTVRDNGPGIPVAERAKVFHRFYRLDASRGTPGNGLGLSLVAAVADLHGVAVKLEDNSPRGLSVTLAFPPSHMC
jgi:signal transduction histidine kinase